MELWGFIYVHISSRAGSQGLSFSLPQFPYKIYCHVRCSAWSFDFVTRSMNFAGVRSYLFWSGGRVRFRFTRGKRWGFGLMVVLRVMRWQVLMLPVSWLSSVPSCMRCILYFVLFGSKEGSSLVLCASVHTFGCDVVSFWAWCIYGSVGVGWSVAQEMGS